MITIQRKVSDLITNLLLPSLTSLIYIKDKECTYTTETRFVSSWKTSIYASQFSICKLIRISMYVLVRNTLVLVGCICQLHKYILLLKLREILRIYETLFYNKNSQIPLQHVFIAILDCCNTNIHHSYNLFFRNILWSSCILARKNLCNFQRSN